MHTVAVLALDGVVPFDLSTPLEVFGRARLADGTPAYRVLVCASTPEVTAGGLAIRVPCGLDGLHEADTIVVPGLADVSTPVPPLVLQRLREAAERGVRLASICAGAFTLAAAGVLDGLRATTHWLAAAELARRYPAVEVDPDVLYVDNGNVLTSAGAAAGLDLCLHMIRRDHGAAVAAHAARISVMPMERDGGQAQFIVHAPPSAQGCSLEPLLRWMSASVHEPLTLAAIAARANLSIRTLSRRFREQTGTTPQRWLHHARIHRAQYLLETTDYTLDRIARQAGFGSATTFRDRFKGTVGVSPQTYRRRFTVAETR
jgi:transcriptional regulator GlxA family with amidase domain